MLVYEERTSLDAFLIFRSFSILRLRYSLLTGFFIKSLAPSVKIFITKSSELMLLRNIIGISSVLCFSFRKNCQSFSVDLRQVKRRIIFSWCKGPPTFMPERGYLVANRPAGSATGIKGVRGAVEKVP